LVFYRDKAVADINNEDVIIYNNEYILKKNLSASFQDQTVNAIKLFFQTIRETKMMVDKIHRPKNAKTLPNVLSKEETFRLIDLTTNVKTQNIIGSDLLFWSENQ
jgi:integrase/recombinase XerD